MLFIFALSARAGENDFNIQLHTKLNELLYGLRDEMPNDHVPTASQFEEILQRRSQEFLEKSAEFVGRNPVEKSRIRKVAEVLTREIRWKDVAATALKSVEGFQNRAALKGLVAFSVLFVHIAAGWILPPILVLVGQPELILAVWAYPITSQGFAAALVVKSVADFIRLRRIYGRETLQEMAFEERYARKQLSMSGQIDVLLPVLRKWGKYEVVISNPGKIASILKPFLDFKLGVSWKELKSRFGTNEGEPGRVFQVIEAEKDLSTDEKTAFFLSYLSRERVEELEDLLKLHRRSLGRQDLPVELFHKIENWAAGFQDLEEPAQVFDFLRAAPPEAPTKVVWELWKEFGLTAFLANNRRMDLIERRAWSRATSILAARNYKEKNKWDFPFQIQSLRKELQIQHEKMNQSIPDRAFRYCFSSLSKILRAWAH